MPDDGRTFPLIPRLSRGRAPDEWPDEEEALLRKLWAEGLSARIIGIRTGRGKNAVIGKAHRLGLPGRASPIKWSGESSRAAEYARRSVRRRAGAVTLPPLMSLMPKTPRVRQPRSEEQKAAKRINDRKRYAARKDEILAKLHARRAKPPSEPAAAPQTPSSPIARLGDRQAWGSLKECAWPIGEPGTKGFHMCDKLTVSGRPYCADHCLVAYVRGARPTEGR